MTNLGPSNLTFPWQPYFDRHVFRNFDFLTFLTRIFPVFFNFHFLRSFYRLFNGFCWFLINFDGFGGFWRELEIQDSGPRWPPLKNDNVIPTSCDVIRPLFER